MIDYIGELMVIMLCDWIIRKVGVLNDLFVSSLIHFAVKNTLWFSILQVNVILSPK